MSRIQGMTFEDLDHDRRQLAWHAWNPRQPIDQGGLLTEGRIDEAVELLERVRAGHPLSTAAWFDLPGRIATLRSLETD